MHIYQSSSFQMTVFSSSLLLFRFPFNFSFALSICLFINWYLLVKKVWKRMCKAFLSHQFIQFYSIFDLALFLIFSTMQKAIEKKNIGLKVKWWKKVVMFFEELCYLIIIFFSLEIPTMPTSNGEMMKLCLQWNFEVVLHKTCTNRAKFSVFLFQIYKRICDEKPWKTRCFEYCIRLSSFNL